MKITLAGSPGSGKSTLREYEENIMKIEEEISNNTLCN